MSTCRSCGAEIKWIETKAGKMMPVDPTPLEEGEGVLGKVVDDGSGTLYISHFATCLEADSWRKPSAAKKKIAAKAKSEGWL